MKAMRWQDCDQLWTISAPRCHQGLSSAHLDISSNFTPVICTLCGRNNQLMFKSVEDAKGLRKYIKVHFSKLGVHFTKEKVP